MGHSVCRVARNCLQCINHSYELSVAIWFSFLVSWKKIDASVSVTLQSSKRLCGTMDPFMGRASEVSGRIKEKASREYRVSHSGHELGGLRSWVFHGLSNWNIWHNLLVWATWLKVQTRLTLCSREKERDEIVSSFFDALYFEGVAWHGEKRVGEGVKLIMPIS